VESFLKTSRWPAGLIVRAIRLDAIETDFVAINEFLDDACTRAQAEVREFMESLDEQVGYAMEAVSGD